MFGENMKIFMYKVIGAVIYIIIDDYICIDYLGLLQENVSKQNNKFENTKFNDWYGLGIPEILMNIISYHGFYKYSILTVILKFHNALVPYDLSKGFLIVETEVGGVNNIPITVKKPMLLI